MAVQLYTIDVERFRDVVRLSIRGELDISVAVTFQNELEHHLDGAMRVLLDLAQLSHLDSSALTVLLRIAERAKARGKCFSIANPNAHVKNRLRLSGVDRLFDLGTDYGPPVPA